MENRKDPTRREFLLELAKKGTYLAPLVASFAVAPELLAAQVGSPPGKMMMMMMMGMGMAAPAAAGAGAGAGATEAGSRPSELHPAPSRKKN